MEPGMKAILIGALILAAAHPAPGAAQTWATQSGLLVGERIRVHSRAGTVVTGRLVSASDGALVIHSGEGRPDLTFPLGEVKAVEKNLGRHRRFGRNFLITLLATSATGGVVGAATWSPCEETGWFSCMFHPDTRSEAFLGGLAGGAVVGVPIGVVVGLLVRSEKWGPAWSADPTHEGSGVKVRPLVLGRSVGVSVSFPLRD